MNKENETPGLFDKYKVTKTSGYADPNAEYFVLRIDKDKHAQIAAIVYAESIRDEHKKLSRDLIKRIRHYRK